MAETKTISSPVRMDEETKQLLRDRARAHGLSESGYIRMLIRREAGIMKDRDPRRTPRDLFRELFWQQGYAPNDEMFEQMGETPSRADVNRLSKAIDLLDERQAAFIRDRFFEGLTYAEIAARHNLSVSRTGQIIHRAIARLRHPKRTRVILGKANSADA